MEQDDIRLKCPYCGGDVVAGQRFCPMCGAARVASSPPSEDAVPDAAPSSAGSVHDLAAVLQELRALRALQAQTGIRLRRLEEQFGSLELPQQESDAAAGGEEFTFQNDGTGAAVADEAAPSLDTRSHFKYAPGDRPHPEGGDFFAPSPPRGAPPLRRIRRRLASETASRRDSASLESAVGQKWLLAIGLVVMVFGIGYFLKYTFIKEWIGPAGQLTLAYVWAGGLLAAGEITRRKGYELFGLWVLAGGIASLYFATFAGFKLFDLLPQAPAFGLLVATTVAAIALAVRYNALGLAVLGLLGGYLTPALLDGLHGNVYFLFGYLTVLNAGVLATAFFKRWSGFYWLGLAGTFILFSYWHFDEYGMWYFWPSLVFVNLTFLGYATVPLVGRPVRNAGPEAQRAAAWLAAAASYMGMVYSYSIIDDRFNESWVALPCLLYALVFGGLAVLQRSSQPKKSVENKALDRAAVLSTHGALYFVLAVPMAFEGSLIAALWALQGAVLFYLGLRFEGRGLLFMGKLALIGGLSRLLFWDYEESYGLVVDSGLKSLQGAVYTFYGGFFSRLFERLATEGAVLGALGYSSWLTGRMQWPSDAFLGQRGARQEGGLLHLVFIAGLLAVLSVECLAFFGEMAPDARSATLSALWALYATGLTIWGFRMGSRMSRYAALTLFAVTLLKVVMVDMEAFSTLYRILSFLVLGALLVAASFLYHKYKDRLELGASAADAVKPTPEPVSPDAE